jgi:hypothetical protein
MKTGFGFPEKVGELSLQYGRVSGLILITHYAMKWDDV